MTSNASNADSQKRRLLEFESICDQFEQLWQDSGKADLPAFLAELKTNSDQELVEELIRIDLAYRDDAGISVESEDYVTQLKGYETIAGHVMQDRKSSKRNETGNLAFSDSSRYEVQEKIASGGMGTVFRALDKRLNRAVALKVMRSDLVESATAGHRFATEAKSIAQLKHSGIVEIYDADVVDGQVCIALELIDGGTLSNKIDRRPQDPYEAASLLIAIVGAVESAHDAGVIHRDLKPSNILMTRDGEPKVADFGLAKFNQEDQLNTRTGELIGTAAYMSPEQALGDVDAIDARTDVYGLGAILYELLTGLPPFQGQSSWDTIQQLLSRDPVPPRTLQPSIPVDLETICLKCLGKESADRYPSVAELHHDLQLFLEGRPIKARPVGPIKRFIKTCRRYKSLTATIVISLAAILVVSVVSFWNIINQRNQAIRNLYDSSISSSRALLQFTDNDWWQQAEKDLQMAADYRRGDQPATELQELALSWMGTTRPSLMNERVIKIGNSPVAGVGFVYEGANIVAASKQGQLSLFNSANGNALWTRQLHAPVKRLQVASITNSVAVLFEDGTLSVYSFRKSLNGNVDFQEQVIAESVTSHAVDANGEHLAYANVAGELIVQTIVGGQVLGRINLGDTTASCLAFSGKGDRLAVGLEDKSIATYDWKTEKKLGNVSINQIPVAIEFDATGSFVIYSDRESFGIRTLRSDDLKTVGGRPNMTDGTIHDLIATSQQRTLVASGDGTIRMFSRASSNHVAQGVSGNGAALCLAMNSEQDRILVGHTDGSVVIWRRIQSPYVFSDFNMIHWCCFSNSNAKLYANYYEHLEYDFRNGIPRSSLSEWELNTARNARRSHPDGHEGPVWGVAISPDDRLIATASHDGTCKVWSAVDGELLATIDAGFSIAWSVQFSADGSRLTFSGDGVVVVDTRSFAIEATHFEHSGIVFAVNISEDGKWVFSSGKDGTIRLWNVDGNESPVIVEQQNSPVHSIALRPDGKQLAAACEDSSVMVFDTTFLGRDVVHADLPAIQDELESSKRIVNDHAGAVHGVAYSRDSRWLVSGSQQGNLLIHDPQSLDQIVKFQNGRGQIRCISFSADNRFMAVSSYARPMIVWDLQAVRKRLLLWDVDWN